MLFLFHQLGHDMEHTAASLHRETDSPTRQVGVVDSKEGVANKEKRRSKRDKSKAKKAAKRRESTKL